MQGVEVWDPIGSVGRVGGNRVTGAASARLLRLFVRRLVRHHGFEASLLWSVGGRSQRSDEKDTVRNVSSTSGGGGGRWQQLASAVPFLIGATGSCFAVGCFTAGSFVVASRMPCP